METPTIHKVFTTLDANEERQIHHPGQGIVCRSLGGETEIEVKLVLRGHGNSSFLPLEVGEKFMFPHDTLILKNPLAKPIDVQLYQVSNKDTYEDLRQRGEVDIFGNVTSTGQPTTDKGGSITQLGSSQYSVEALGAGGNIDIVAAVNNVNGIVLQWGQVSIISNTGTSWFSLNIGGGHILGARTPTETVRARDIRLPSGLPLKLFQGVGVTANVSVSYDILP